MDFSTSQEFSVSIDDYLKVYFASDFEQFMTGQASFKRRKVLDMVQQGPIIKRDLEICSDIELPALLKKVVGNHELSYIEHSITDLERYETRWQITPNFLVDKIKASGITTLRPLGPGRTERVHQGSVVVSIPFIGRLAENFIIEAIRTSDQETAHLFSEFNDITSLR
ncbi:DUF2505 family protein [bacterium]|nr:DUF2505 family protein [bacterium]